MASQNAIALNDLSNSSDTEHVAGAGEASLNDQTAVIHEFSLPRADGGKDAWLFLVAGFIVEALVWGFPFSFGVFQDYYTTHEPFSSNPKGIAIIGTTSTGIMYMSGLLLFPAYKMFPYLATRSKWAGLPIMAISLIAASFATNVNHLILTQGALFAIGGSIVYCPVMLFMDEWFIQRKGFAYGVIWAGTGASGLIIPFILNALLSKYGFRTTLRIWSVALLILSTPLIYFLRPRLPISPVSHLAPSTSRYLLTSSFWLLCLGLAMESMGFFIPSLYLPSYAHSLSLSPKLGTMLVSLLNTSSVFATILMGILCDHFHVTTVILFSTIGATLSTFLFWGFATEVPLLVVFSIVYGFFAGGFVATNAGMLKMVKEREAGVDVGILIGFISAARGVGAIACGPLSELLVNGIVGGKSGYGGRFGELIVFTGVTAACGGVSWVGRRVGWV